MPDAFCLDIQSSIRLPPNKPLQLTPDSLAVSGLVVSGVNQGQLTGLRRRCRGQLSGEPLGGVSRLQYDIDRIETHGRDLGFAVRRPSQNEVTITILGEAVLAFENLPEDPDTVMGFLGTPWHSHDNLVLSLDGSRYEEFEPTKLLSALKSGDVIVVERFLNSVLEDRWVQHKLEPLDLKYVAEGEQLRIHRLP